MVKSASINVRISPEVKRDTEKILAEYGLNLSEAINVFLHQVRRVGGIPFDLRPSEPNEVTAAAMREADDMLKDDTSPRFKDAREMFAALDAEPDDEC